MDWALKIVSNLINAHNQREAYQAVIASTIEACGSEMIQGSVKETMKLFFKCAASRNVLDASVS